jgi:TetR/AcrR family transcriptional regulator, regulator of mycofactocin system
MPTTGAAARRAAGRPPSTTHRDIERVAVALFASRGFDETTVEDIAAAAGIGRRTLFRYFPSKNDIVFGDFDGLLERTREHLRASPPDEPLLQALRRTVIATNDYHATEIPEFRTRTELIATVPTLQSYSTLRYADWRRVVAGFAAARLGQAPEALMPQAIAHAALGAALAAFYRWVQCEGTDVAEHLNLAFEQLAAGFAGAALVEEPRARGGGAQAG